MLATAFATVAIILHSLFLGVMLPAGAQTYEIIRKPPIMERKAIYLSAYTAGWKARRQELVDLINETELNAIIIDIKDSTGGVYFDTKNKTAIETGAVDVRIPDLKEWLQELKEQGIYTIARQVVFQDPNLAAARPEIALRHINGGLWRDWKGLSWVDPTREEVWQYNMELSKEAIELGFDEINLDYIRFPSDGNISAISYHNIPQGWEKYDVMRGFYAYVDQELGPQPARVSGDLFGMTLWRNDGMSIGQRLEDAAPYFDYIMPMVYPSHYPTGFEGFTNPAEHPYEIIYGSVVRYKDMVPDARAIVSPWLQDFDLGAVYTPAMIELQKQATYDSGGTGWALWNARNVYTVGGLQPEAN